MGTLTTEKTEGNDVDTNTNPHEIFTWLEDMVGRGELGDQAARLRGSAIRTLLSILTPEEPRDVPYLLENVEGLGRRWATKERAKPDTAATYVSRARGTFGDYLRWQQD